MKPQYGARVPCDYEVYEVKAAAHHIETSHGTALHYAGGIEDVARPCVKSSRQRHCMKQHVVMVLRDDTGDLRQAALWHIKEFGNVAIHEVK